MYSETVMLPCPFCGQETLVARPIPRIERVSPKFQSHTCLGQLCSCEGAALINLIHASEDEDELMEVCYEYTELQFCRHPIFDTIFGRFAK